VLVYVCIFLSLNKVVKTQGSCLSNPHLLLVNILQTQLIDGEYNILGLEKILLKSHDYI